MARATSDIKTLARAHTSTAIKVLQGIMNNDKVQASARVAAAQCLLDRGWGKPAQAVEITGEVVNKVIRSPEVAANTEQWLEQHTPTEHQHATH